MNSTLIPAAGLALLLTGFACQSPNTEKAMADISAQARDTSNTANDEPGGGRDKKEERQRKFIRTADLKCRVSDVMGATYAIEDLISRSGGFLTSTELNSPVQDVVSQPVSPDSILERTRYTVENNITFRIPDTRMDSLVKAVAAISDFVDHRTIKADDVSLQLLSNRLTQQRTSSSNGRVGEAGKKSNRKLQETILAEGWRLDRQAAYDEAYLANLDMQDKIDYSTVTVMLYQQDIFRQVMQAREKELIPYTPGFFSRMGAAVTEGWTMLGDLVIIFARFWVFLLFGLILYLGFRRNSWKNRRMVH